MTSLLTCVASGCRCMNSPRSRPCARCTHEVTTAHFESAEFVYGRGAGDELFCGSCGEEVAATTRATRHEALATHFQREHPELARSHRFRERTIQGARFFFEA